VYPGATGRAHAYHFGSGAELNHDIIQVLDGAGRIIVKNTYGIDPTDASFDKIIDQQIGELDTPESHSRLEYHDLQLEALEDATTPASKPNPALVVPRASFVSKNLCPLTCSPGSGVNGWSAHAGSTEHPPTRRRTSATWPRPSIRCRATQLSSTTSAAS